MGSDQFTFETATKDQAKARIALAGPSGSGKTWTALAFAARFGKTVAVIDTERGSASKYAGDFTFDRLNLTRYDPRDLPKALAVAASRGYETVVIDSLSRFWSGEGGMLEQVDNAGKRSFGGNQFGGWKEARPMENAMIEAMLGYPGHVIVTMRTKTAWEIVTEDGKKKPVKIGLKPEQRDGIEYEFDIVCDMDADNTLTVSKSRCAALSGAVVRKPDAAVADVILAWLDDGRPVMDATWFRDQALRETDPGALRQLWSDARQLGINGAAVIDEHGETATLGDLIARKGKEAIPGRPPEDLPRNANGAISRSQTTDAEKDAAGLMTDGQQKKHTALNGGHPKERRTPKADRAKVTREQPTAPAADIWAPIETENRPGQVAPGDVRKIHAIYTGLGFTATDREQLVNISEKLIGRTLTGPEPKRTHNNLTHVEAQELLATLKGFGGDRGKLMERYHGVTQAVAAVKAQDAAEGSQDEGSTDDA